MPYIFAEWFCPKCKGIHRVRYSLKAQVNILGDIRIYDPALHRFSGNLKKYLIAFEPDMETKVIIERLREHIQHNYTTEEDTLKIEVCMSE